MKLLISITNKDEVIEAALGGADIIDIKNPLEGSLGAPFPRIIKSIEEVAPANVQISVAIGDAPDLPGTVSLAALGAVSCNIDYVKLGIYGPASFDSALLLAREASRAAKEGAPDIRVVIAGYADHRRVGCLETSLIPEIVRRADADVAMVDTKVKDGTNVFSFLSCEQLQKFVEEAHANGLSTAIAGSLGIGDIKRLCELGADIAGFRGAACAGDRVKGQVKRDKVLKIKDQMKAISPAKL